MSNTSKPVTVRVHRPESNMNKKAKLDGPVYMEFKSYKFKDPPTSRLKSKTSPRAPLSSGENLSPGKTDSACRLKELQKELKLVKDQQIQQTRSIETLRRENETLRAHVNTLVSPRTHQQLQLQRDQSEQRCEKLQEKIDQLAAVDEIHDTTVRRLNDRITQLRESQDDLRKQLQTEIDLKKHQLETNQRLVRDTEILHQTVRDLTGENQSLKRDNQALANQTEQLKAQVTAVDRKANLIDSVQKKLKIYETEIQRKARENKTLSDKNDSCTKFVQILENDLQTVKKQNLSAIQHNKQLRKQLSGMKKSLERLRQKYDEINRENRLLKEKETRYLLHERFNVGKYAGKLPVSGILRANETAESSNVNSAVTQTQMRNYMRAANNVKTTRTQRFDQHYHLLHRPESVWHNETDAATINNTTKK